MAVVDLTNTMWVFHDVIDLESWNLPDSRLPLTFASGGESFSTIRCYKSSASGPYNLQYNYEKVYISDGTAKKWDLYKEISITGGEYATNADFIAWLQNNATQTSKSYRVFESDLTAVADAIRTKSGTSEPLSFPDGFIAAINGI